MARVLKALAFIAVIVVASAAVIFWQAQDATPSATAQALSASVDNLNKSLSGIAADIDKASADRAATRSLLDNVALIKPHYQRDEFTFTASFTIQNSNPRAIKDIEITCTHFAKSGTSIDSNRRVIYDVFKPGQTRINSFNMGFIHSQAATTSCRVTDASPI